jgi:hypothetical protein
MARTGVGLHDAAEAGEENLGMLTAAVGRVEVGGSGWIGAAEGSVVAHHCP